jgi:hypothetical protein
VPVFDDLLEKYYPRGQTRGDGAPDGAPTLPRAAVLPRSVRTKREQARPQAQREAHARQRREAERQARLQAADDPRRTLVPPSGPTFMRAPTMTERLRAPYQNVLADLEGTSMGTLGTLLSLGALDVGNVRRRAAGEANRRWQAQTAGLSRAEIEEGIDAGTIDQRVLGGNDPLLEAAWTGPFGRVKGAIGAVKRRLPEYLRRGRLRPGRAPEPATVPGTRPVPPPEMTRVNRRPGVSRAPGLEQALQGGGPRPRVDLTPRPLSPSARAADDVRVDSFIRRHQIPEASLPVVRGIIRDANNFLSTRGRTQTWKQTDALADDIAINVRNVNPKRPLPADELNALGRTVAGLSGKIDEAVTAVRRTKGQLQAGDLSEADRRAADAALPGAELDLQIAMEEAKIGWEALFGVSGAAARSLNSLKQFKQARKTGNVAFYQEALNRGAPMRKMADAMLTLTDDLSRARFLRDLTKPTMQDWWRWYYLSSLLSAPITQMRNLMGSGTRVVGELVTPLGAGDIREAGAGFQGSWDGMKQGWRKAAHMWQQGYSIDNIRPLEDVPKGVEIAGSEKWPNVIARAMETGDQFFRAMSGEIAGHTGAFRRAKAAGFKPGSSAFNQRYTEILTNRPPDLIKEMAEAGAEAVFRPPPGAVQSAVKKLRGAADRGAEKFGEAVYQGAKNIGLPEGVSRPLGVLMSAPVGTWMLPFLQTPAGVYRAGAAFSPYGALVGRYRMGKLRKAGMPRDPYLATEATAEMARARRLTSQGNIGSLMLAPLAWMAAEGKLTGSGPKGDPKERKQWLKTHQPNSILIGNTWYNYSMFQPISVPASVIANAWEAFAEKGWKTPLGDILARTANSQLQASYLSSVMAITNAIEDPERYGGRWSARQTAAMVPLSSFFRNIARAGDPVSRDPEGAWETIQTALPGMTQNVPERLDLFGEPIVYGLPEESTLNRLLNPVYRQRQTDDPLVQELDRTGARLTPATDTLGEMPLTRQQRFAVEQQTARGQAQAIRTLIASEEYQALPTNEEKVEMIHDRARITREVYRKGLRLRMIPTLMQSLQTLPPGSFRDDVERYLRSLVPSPEETK